MARRATTRTAPWSSSFVAEAGWEARPDVEVLIFSRGGQLSSMEYVHYDADIDVSNAEFPPAEQLQPRSRH